MDICKNVLFLKILKFTNIGLQILRFLVPILLILKISIDVYRGIIDVKTQEAKEKIAKRVLAAVIIFLVPTFVNLFLSLFGSVFGNNVDYSSCLVNIKNIEYYEELKDLTIEKQEESASKESLEKFQKTKIKVDTVVEEAVDKSKKGESGTNKQDDVNKITLGQKYKLSESQVRGLCGVARSEQGSLEGAKAEASLMANLYELLKPSSKYYQKGLYNYVRNGGWFAHAAKHMAKGCPDKKYYDAIYDILVNGNRVLPLYINEHDCFHCNSKRRCSNGNWGDICYINNGTKDITSMNTMMKRSSENFIPNVTKIYTVYKSKSTIKYWVFYSFPSRDDKTGAIKGDPFGYTLEAKEKVDAMNK